MKLKNHKFISLIIIGTGLVLVAFMVVTEDEPGALPLLLVAAGTGWYFITRSRIRKHQAQL